MSEDKRNIYQRMLAVMAEVGYVQKSDKKVNNQYTFVSHDAVVAAVRSAFITHGVMMHSSVTGHTQDGNRTTADVHVKFINVDEPEDCIEGDFFGYGVDPQDKGPGKAMSYAKKYAILTELLLETGDDPERDTIDHETDEQVYEREKRNMWNKCLKFAREKGALFPDIVTKEAFVEAWKNLEDKSLDNLANASDAVMNEMLQTIKARDIK